MWAIGRYDLGLTDNEFWGLTLLQFNKLCERHKEKRSADLFNSALICSVIANVNRQKGKPFTPQDFMPKEKKRNVMKMEDMLEVLKSFTLAQGGEVNC